MIYNINIKVNGDIWDYQDYHDRIMDNFKFNIERKLSHPDFYSLRGDLNFIYHSEVQKFEIVSFPEKFKGRLDYVFETDRDFRKKYFIN